MTLGIYLSPLPHHGDMIWHKASLKCELNPCMWAKDKKSLQWTLHWCQYSSDLLSLVQRGRCCYTARILQDQASLIYLVFVQRQKHYWEIKCTLSTRKQIRVKRLSKENHTQTWWTMSLTSLISPTCSQTDIKFKVSSKKREKKKNFILVFDHINQLNDLNTTYFTETCLLI